MNFGHREVCLEHDPGEGHMERPARIIRLRRDLTETHDATFTTPDDATRTQLERVHDADYLDDLAAFCADGGGVWYGDTVAMETTWDAAVASAGVATWAGRRALAGDDGTATPFALGRPPGHHALVNDAMGFCFCNNVVVATADLLATDDVDRVAVVDWDVHHGNGTQELCYDRGDVFYASIHEDGLFPGTGEIAETGAGEGAGTTLNVPFPAGVATPAYLAAIDDLIAPAIQSFGPDVVLVSAGFDAHEGDRMSNTLVTTEGFAAMAARIRALAERCDAGLGFVLEGGYNVTTLSDSVKRINETFAGYEPATDDGPVEDGARDVLEAVRDQGFDGV